MKTHANLQTSFFVLFFALVVGWAVSAPPPVAAFTIVDQADIIDGGFDINEDGVVGTADNLSGVLLFFNDAAPIRADIVGGLVDLNGDGEHNLRDSLSNADLTYKPGRLLLGARRSKQVDIINGQVDVDGGGISSSDDLANVLLVQVLGLPDPETLSIIEGKVYPDIYNILFAFNDAALIRVSIVDNKVDVNQDNVITGIDSLLNADLSEDDIGGQFSDSVSVLSGFVDVNQDGQINELDNATVKVVKLAPSSLPHQVDIIDGKVDVDENGVINGSDDLAGVLLLFNDAAPTRVDIIDGFVDVDEDGAITSRDDLANVDLNVSVVGFRENNQVDIINGLIDVNEDGAITTADDATNVKLLVP